MHPQDRKPVAVAEPLIPTADGFWDGLHKRYAETYVPEPVAKKKRKADGYGRRRWRCDVDGAGRSEDHVGNGRLCKAHPEAKSHDWRMGGPLAEGEAFIAWHMEHGYDVPNAIERFNGVAWSNTSQGEVAMAYALLSRWGRLSATAEAF